MNELLAIQTDLTGEADYSIRTTLDGKEYNFHFLWNQRVERWNLSIKDDADTLLVGSITLVSNWPLLRGYRADPNVPPGELLVLDASADKTPPGLGDFGVGRRCTLVYLTATDL